MAAVYRVRMQWQVRGHCVFGLFNLDCILGIKSRSRSNQGSSWWSSLLTVSKRRCENLNPGWPDSEG